jgi:DNA-binding CsgD family transcriptional regulator
MGARTWPFVGREALAERVTGHLDADRSVVLVGAAGMGKTRVAAAVADAVAASGASVHRIAASPAASPLPLAPFARLAGDASGAAAVQAVLDALGADGRSGPADPLLVVDDLHLLDDASAIVLHQLLVSGRIRVLATLRTGAPAPAAVTTLRREHDVIEVEVERLSAEDVVAMVEGALQGPMDARSRHVLVSVADGNALYAREAIEGSVDSGALVSRGGVWTLLGDVTATPLLEEIVLARLAPLEGPELEAMELLAIGGALDHHLLQQTVGDDALERLERRELIRAHHDRGPVTVDVAHPLHRELLRLRLGGIARMRISRSLARADGAPAPGRPAHANLRSAVWHLRGGLDVDPALLLDAAHHAQRTGDTPLASELAQAAFASSKAPEAGFLASWCLAECGRHDDAIEVLRSAREFVSTPWERSAIRLRIAEELWWTGRLDAGLAELDADDAPDGPWRALLDGQRGVFAMLDGDLAAAHRWCDPLVDHDHLWVRFVAAIAVGHGMVYEDRTDETLAVCARVVADAAITDVALLGDPNLHLAIQLVALMHRGEIGPARELAVAAHHDAAGQPSVQVRAWAAMLAGQAATFAGDAVDSVRLLAEAEQLWASCGLQGFASWCAAGLVRAQIEVGLVGEAGETMARLHAYERRGFGLYEPLVHLAAAWHAVGSGNRVAGAAAVRRALDIAVGRGQEVLRAWAWHDAVRLDLLGLVDGLDGWKRPTGVLAAARHDLVHAVARSDAEALAAVSARFEEMGALQAAGDAAVFASALARRSGRSKDAARLESRAGVLFGRCGAGPSPALAGRSTRGALSPREHEVAERAAQGWSNRRIAGHLVVSERTVENHLYRVFIKLGISSRDELAPALASLC